MQKLTARQVFGLIAAFLCTNCSSLTSYRSDDTVGTTTYRGTLRPGLVAYALPKTVLVVTANYLLTQCNPSGVDITATASISTETSADPAEVYYLDAKAFQNLSLLKTSDLKADVYPSRVLQDVNGLLSDQTGTVVASALGAALSAATTLGKFSPFVRGTAAPCTDGVNAALKSLDDKQAAIDGSKASGDAALSSAALSSLQAEVATLTKSLTISSTARIDLAATDFVSGIYTTDLQSPIGSWFQGALPTFSGPVDPTNLAVAIWSNSIAAEEESTVRGTTGFIRSGNPIDGVVYRVPAAVHVRACFGKCDVSNVSARKALTPPNVAFDNSGTLISQLGKAFVAPLKNGLFRDDNLSLSQDTTGALLSVEFKNTSTLSTFFSTLGQVFSGTQTQYNATIQANATALNAQSTALTTQSNVAAANATLADTTLAKQADCLTQQAAIISAGSTPKTSC